MARRFKVGDRVRVLCGAGQQLQLGAVVVVTDAYQTDGLDYVEVLGSTGRWDLDRFELVEEAPSTDPKAAHGAAKPPLALIPPAAQEACARVLEHGAAKYGSYNWRVRAGSHALMTYLHAMKRHIDRVIDGEWVDPESGQPHIGHVMAGASIVLDAKAFGSLVVDTPSPIDALAKQTTRGDSDDIPF